MAENCEKISWVFSLIFSHFVFHIMFNRSPALFRGQISVLLLKLEVFISFVSSYNLANFLLFLIAFFQSMVMYGTSLFRTGEGRETARRLGREQLGFYFSRGFTARSRARFCSFVAQWCSRQNCHAMQANSFSLYWCMLFDCVIHQSVPVIDFSIY